MRAVVECMEDSRNAAVKAGFPPRCGLEMLQGCFQVKHKIGRHSSLKSGLWALKLNMVSVAKMECR